MDIDYGNSSSWFKSRIDSSDRQFVLGTGDDSVRVVTIRFEVTEDTLMTLENPIFDSEIILWARSDTVSDAAQSNIQVQLRKIIVDTGEDTSGGFDFVGAATWLGFIVIIVGGIVITVRILRSVEEEEDEYANWGQDGYQDSLTSTYQSVISAPTVPSGPPASVPASMPPQMPAEPVTAPAVSPAPVQEVVQPTEVPVQTGPPLPETGLPAGWTMEQWNAYGEMWLSQNQQN